MDMKTIVRILINILLLKGLSYNSYISPNYSYNYDGLKTLNETQITTAETEKGPVIIPKSLTKLSISKSYKFDNIKN